MLNNHLSTFFIEELSNINRQRGKKLSEECVIYMAHLLVKGADRDFIFEDNQKKYLVDLYQKSIEADSYREKFRNYKHLGDYSLFISGYFTESIDELVGIEYYINMGSRAYAQAAISLYRDPYLELADNYPVCVSIINELSLRRVAKPYDILRLYNFWLATQSQFTKEKLLKLGLITEAINE